jgi:hydrogenase maturation factor
VSEPPRVSGLLHISPAPPGRPTVPECHGDVCITCSDQAVPVRVIRLLGDGLALVDTGVSEEEVSVALVEARAGDTILVHAKEALTVIGGEDSDGN